MRNMRSRRDTNRTRRRIRWTRVLLVLLVLAGLLAAFAGAALYAYLNYFGPAGVAGGAVPDKGKSADVAQMRKVNVLVLGIDDGDSESPGAAKRSDTMIVASIDPEDGKVGLLSIPRDTRVTIPGRKGYDKITHAYAYGGAGLAVATVEELLGVPVNYYVVMDWRGFINVVDILGGVGLYVESDMNYDDPYANLSIHLKKGYQHLNGEKAGQYVRFRHDELGDIGRVQRQQRFMKAMSEEMLQFGTLLKLPALTQALQEYVTTDMPPLTMLKLANSMKNFKDGGLKAELLPGRFATVDGLSYWVADREETKTLVQKIFFSDRPRVSGQGPGSSRSN